MRRFLLYIHQKSQTIKEIKRYKQTNRLMWFVYESIRRLSQLCFNVHIRLRALIGHYPKPLYGDDDLVVSLTTFPARIDIVWMAIDSIFYQKVQPSRIYLYLSEEEFPNGRNQLPKRLLYYEKLGLEICFRPYNLMPHTKYFYALQEHYDKCVITIDDDIYYHNDMIFHLLTIYNQCPGTVCANISRRIQITNKGEMLPYNNWCWKQPEESNSSHLNLALGTSGVLYPPMDYAKSGMFEKRELCSLSLRADDLWLKAHEIVGNIKVSTTDYYCQGIPILTIGNISLSTANVKGGGNDEQWQKLSHYYDLTKKITEIEEI